MRSMRYVTHTYCMDITNDGDIMTLGSRDKYYFNPSRRDSMAELYLFRFVCGRATNIEQQEYEIKVLPLSDCYCSNFDIVLKTGDIMLGVASSQTPTDGGSGCTPYLYLLRPTFQRSPNTVKNPTHKRVCGGN